MTPPDPLTPADCDLRGLPFMPLDVVRLADSDLVALTTGEEFKAAVLLWTKAWLQVPAASVPDDDRILAHLSGAGARWRKVKEMALHGWIKCADGRLYHPVVAEKANEAWKHRQAQRDRANKRWGNAAAPSDGNANGYAAVHANAAAVASPTAMQGRGTGTVKGEEEKQPSLIPSENEGAGDARNGARSYAFEGKVIKLTAPDLRRWRETYHGIPDIQAELLALDAWFEGQDDAKRKRWFHTASGALNRKHQEVLAAAAAEERSHEMPC